MLVNSSPSLEQTPVIGMGGSRLGSMLARAGGGEAAAAVRAAVDAGISLFDTADIYGQGSSELILGRTLPASGVEVCTKAGFVPPAPLWVLRLAKPLMRHVIRRRGDIRAQLAQRRSEGYPQLFEPAYLSHRLQASLGRLRRERVDVFLLHNPPPSEALRDGLWRWVDRELARGRIGAFGVSCGGEATDQVWLDYPTVTVVQIPARSAVPHPGGLTSSPKASRLRIILREAVGPGNHTTDTIVAALQAITAARVASAVILGMSTAKHVREVAARFPVRPRPLLAAHSH